MTFILLFTESVFAQNGSSSYTQKRVQTVGGIISYGTDADNLGIGIVYQYGILDQLRFDSSFNYYLEDGTNWDVNANLHYIFPVLTRLQAYPLVGLSYNRWSSGDSSIGKLGMNLGGGAQYNISEVLNLKGELKYQIIENYNQIVISIGIMYKF